MLNVLLCKFQLDKQNERTRETIQRKKIFHRRLLGGAASRKRNPGHYLLFSHSTKLVTVSIIDMVVKVFTNKAESFPIKLP
mmetsp:Transcript_17857/g.22770  ORF Transcript_17857/g.22770 Transcript_17857/m.22770 type:complete len:81 (-) Transcript_17857:32-274(-)